jgi:hypothetical protein
MEWKVVVLEKLDEHLKMYYIASANCVRHMQFYVCLLVMDVIYFKYAV